MRVLLLRPDSVVALLDGIEARTLQLGDLKLDQKQALAAHPNKALADRAKKLLEAGGGLPSPDRVKVLEELLPVATRGGDAKVGKEVFKKNCAKCHQHSGEGEKIGPDLTGMAVHSKEELLTNVIDPNRSVEGNFRVYTVALKDGRTMSGLLAGESKTTLELFDSEGKKHSLLREDVDELIA
ncbi:MAG: c-type cytochrome, partial [Planctomycetota bacterium]|nr:c-type cytochrome [Planctomycetota bacterium]